jgi:acyl-CoA thioesterase
MNPNNIVAQMLQNDNFSKWLGIKVIKVSVGYCKLKCKVKKEVLNGFGIAHGGFTYSIADSALAFASNSNGIKSLSIETSISHLKKIKENDLIIVEAKLMHENSKFGYYEAKLTYKKEIIALFKGTVFKTENKW